MFGSSKKAVRPAEKLIHGWREHDLSMLVRSLRGDRPNIRTEINGFRQGIAVEGDIYASRIHSVRTDHELYTKSALLFDGVPGNEDDIELVKRENEVVGLFSFGRVRVEGNFEVSSNIERLKKGDIGSVSVTYLKGFDTEPDRPLLKFGFELSTPAEEFLLQNALRGAVATGGAYINLALQKVENVDEWERQFREDGYSTGLKVRRVFVGAQVGKGTFD